VQLEEQLEGDVLYNIYNEGLVRQAKRDPEIGIKDGGASINVVKYADDKAVVSHSQKGLQQVIDKQGDTTRK